MTSPQLENGYTRIADELLEALSCLQLSGSEWSIVLCIIRKTYGYNKKEDWVTNTQIAKMTGLGETRISEAKKRLLEAGVITEKRKNVGLNKRYSEWQKLRKSVIEITENRKKNYGKAYTQKTIDNNKRHLAEPSSEKLKANQENMGFQKYSDDYEEEVQIEPDFKPQKKTKDKKVADDVQAVFNLFSNPAKVTWRLRELERVAAQALFDTYGLETLEKRIKRIEAEKKKNADDPYFPLVNTPSSLLDKMESVERYLGI